jgi:hypothetical protein
MLYQQWAGGDSPGSTLHAPLCSLTEYSSFRRTMSHLESSLEEIM